MTKFFERNSTKLTISEFYDNYKLGKYNFDALIRGKVMFGQMTKGLF